MKELKTLTLCARECTACPVVQEKPDGTIRVYDNQRPGEYASFARGDMRKLVDAAKAGQLDTFC